MRVFALTDFFPRVCSKGRLPQDVYDRGFPEGKGTERSINPGEFSRRNRNSKDWTLYSKIIRDQ